ncbi:Cna B-type domain-containing protein [Bifidobacterium sp. 82T10]|uniref:Cna B-type domain-containing protein n=1 Tax=Bifidobacterium miconis TaxID=2834435 RepID=A0ABS6WFF9_9BIFI|nr:Cna B-type domain-containing protein [Bifidobacterium miconis]
MTKKGTYDKSTAPFINYTVTVNAGANTLNKGNALTLTDTLGAALDLRMDSVVISDARTKTDVAGATYAYDPTTKKITFTVPDARAITITYKAMVNLKPGQDFGSLGNNTIVLAGYDQNGGSSSTDQTGKVLEAQGGISYDLNSLQIYKYADGDTTKPLNGAQFKVEKLNVAMDANSSAWTSTGTAETVIDTLKSGTSGYTSTVGLRADTIYRVTEAEAPEGYGKSSAKLYVVFPGNSPQGHPTSFYQGKTVDGTSLTVAAAGNTTLQTYLWSVSNTSDKKGSFKLDKKDEQGHWLNGATFTLTKDGDSSFKQERTTANNTAIEFTELAPGSYTLTETKAPDGYQPANPIAVTVTNAGKVIVNGKTVSSNDSEHLTVTDRSDVTSIRARKVWNDGHNQDGKRQPARFQLHKSVDGGAWTNVGQEKVINESTPEVQAVVEWTDLPVREGGKEVKYQVIEVNADKNGYKTTSADTTATESDKVPTTTFTNTYTPETISVPVAKKWNDANNVDKLRPTAITVQLYANGVAVSGKTLTLNETSQWKGTFIGLPKYANGGLITYTVQEVNPSKDYTASTSGSATDKNGITITNTHYPTDTKIRVSKRDIGGAEIAGATMEINGKTEAGKTVTERWTSEAGKSHEVELEPGSYTLSETKAPTGYRVADPVKFTVVRNDDKTLAVKDADGNVVNGNVIVMTDIYKQVDVKVSKVSLTNGVGEIAGAKLTVTGTTLAGETINPIPLVSTGESREITLVPGTYTLHESEAPSGYQPARDITFTVNLDGTVTVGKDTAKDNTVVMTDELNTTNVTVSKTAVAGVAELAGATFELTGTTFEGDDDPFSADAFQSLDGVTVSKDGKTLTWTSSEDGPRTFQLPNGTYKLHETKAPEGYDVIAKPIAFRVENGKVTVGDVLSSGNLVRVEDAVKSYTAVSVTKRWEDNNDSDGFRKDVKVTAVLYANGEKMTGKEYSVELNADDNHWTHDWVGLPAKDDNGDPITYTVNEETSGIKKDEYHASIVKKPTANGYEFTLYNIHQPDAISLELVKDWDDADNQDGKRPQSIQVTVTGISKRPKTDGTAGTEKYSETLINTVLKAPSDPNENEWKWTLENLPKKNSYGNDYTYIVQETPVPGYNGYDDNGTCTLEGGCATQFTSKKRTEETVRKSKSVEDPAETLYLKNTHTPETTAVTVNKVWDDAQNFNGQRPQSVTVWLLTSLWSQSNGWPEPQGDSCAGDLVGKSCAVLTEANKVKTDDNKTKSDAADKTETNKDAADKDSAESTPAESDQAKSDQADQSESADQSATTDQTAADATGESEPATAADEAAADGTDTADSTDAATTTDQKNSSTEAGDVTAGDADQSAAADATDKTDAADATDGSSATDTDSKADTSGKTDTTDQTATADTWTYTFKNLPKYRNGKLLRYSVTEEAVNNYTATFTDTTQYPSTSAPNGGTDGTDAGNGEATAQATTDEPESYSFTLSNRNVPNKTDLNVRKVWDDNDNAYQKRPGSIWVQLYEKKLGTTATAFTDAAGGAAGRAGTGTGTDGSAFSNTDIANLTAVGDPVELTAQNNWAYTFAELHANKSYEVREVAKNSDGKFVPVSAIDGYQSPIITGDQTKGYTITNSVEPVMPETGGEGTARIMLAGLLLVAMSGAFFTRKALATAGKRNKKGDIR